MNFWVVKSDYWESCLYEDCEGYDWGGEDWIRSKERQRHGAINCRFRGTGGVTRLNIV
jgi:hypothetical protein